MLLTVDIYEECGWRENVEPLPGGETTHTFRTRGKTQRTQLTETKRQKPSLLEDQDPDPRRLG